MAAEIYLISVQESPEIGGQLLGENGYFNVDDFGDDEGNVAYVMALEKDVRIFMGKVLRESPVEGSDEVDLKLSVQKEIATLALGEHRYINLKDTSSNSLIMFVRNIGDKPIYPILN